MSRRRNLIFVMLMVTWWLLNACGDDSSFPDFARPAEAQGFVILGQGNDGRSPYTVAGTQQTFSDAMVPIDATFTEHGWKVLQTRVVDPDDFVFRARSSDDQVCVSYRDLKKDRETTRAFRRVVEVNNPEAVSRFGEFTSVVYASAGRCP